MLLVPGRDVYDRQGGMRPGPSAGISWATWGRTKDESDSFSGISMSVSPGSSWATFGSSSQETEIDLGDSSSSTLLYTPPSHFKLLSTPTGNVYQSTPKANVSPTGQVSQSHASGNDSESGRYANVSQPLSSGEDTQSCPRGNVSHSSTLSRSTSEDAHVTAVQVLQSIQSTTVSPTSGTEMKPMGSKKVCNKITHHQTSESDKVPTPCRPPSTDVVETADEGAVGYAAGFSSPNTSHGESGSQPSGRVVQHSGKISEESGRVSTRSAIPIPTSRFYSRSVASQPASGSTTHASGTDASTSKSKPGKKGATVIKSDYNLRSSDKK